MHTDSQPYAHRSHDIRLQTVALDGGDLVTRRDTLQCKSFHFNRLWFCAAVNHNNNLYTDIKNSLHRTKSLQVIRGQGVEAEVMIFVFELSSKSRSIPEDPIPGERKRDGVGCGVGWRTMWSHVYGRLEYHGVLSPFLGGGVVGRSVGATVAQYVSSAKCVVVVLPAVARPLGSRHDNAPVTTDKPPCFVQSVSQSLSRFLKISCAWPIASANDRST